MNKMSHEILRKNLNLEWCLNLSAQKLKNELDKNVLITQFLFI